MCFCKEYGIVLSEIAKMSPGLWKPQDNEGVSWQQPAGASCAAWDRGDTRQRFLQEVLAKGRGLRVRVAAAPSPDTQPPSYRAESYAKARTGNFLPYLLLISNYLGLGKAKTDLPLLEYCTSGLLIDLLLVTAAFFLKDAKVFLFIS